MIVRSAGAALGVLTLLAPAGCRRDVRLGSAIDAAVVDAPPDGNGNPFAPGSYAVQFLDPSMTMCTGALVGQERSFDVVTRAASGLVDGDVTLTAPTAATLTIAGAPITAGWGQGSVDLVLDASGPPPIWSVVVTGNFGAGPAATTRIGTGLALDPATALAVGGVQGEAAALYANVVGDGQCAVTFGALLVRR
jgi:hypothetical protein